MGKVTDGSSRRFSDSKANLEQIRADRAAAARVGGASLKEQKAVAKQAEKSEAKKAAQEGQFVPKGEVNVGPKLPSIQGCKRIGRWGTVEGGDTTFSKMAKKVYGDCGLWKFIAGQVGMGKVIFIKRRSTLWL